MSPLTNATGGPRAVKYGRSPPQRSSYLNGVQGHHGLTGIGGDLDPSAIRTSSASHTCPNAFQEKCFA